MFSPFLIACIASTHVPDPEAASRLFQRVRGCVYEVVLAKFADTGVTYSEAVSKEELPFQERSDSVWSIGSAFAVGKDSVLTAAHVMELGIGDSIRQPMLRDAEGRVWRIGRILKYSNHQDFVLFTVPGLVVRHPLRPAKKVVIGQTVNAVGNAQGEGIVLRNGLLTSETPEPKNGEWKYYRFSAAASPGNSGGPLLDEQGGLLGVILMKSEAENLNYALPWSTVDAFPPGRARWRQRSAYVHPAMPDRDLWTDADTTFPVPPEWKDLDRLVWTLSRDKVLRDRDSLLHREAQGLFPRQFRNVRNTYFSDPMVQTLRKGQDGYWTAEKSKSEMTLDLGNNGGISISTSTTYNRISIQIPNGVALAYYLDDSRHLGDLLLVGDRLERTYAGRSLRVTSLGKAVVDSIRTDRWGCRWLVRAWEQPWDKSWLVTYLLPLPSGFRGFSTMVAAGTLRPTAFLMMDDLADATLTNWYGTISQWRAWKKRSEIIPPFLESFRVDSIEDQPQVNWESATLRMIPETSNGPDARNEPVMNVCPAFHWLGRDSVGVVAGIVALGADQTFTKLVSAVRISPPDSGAVGSEHLAWKKWISGKAISDEFYSDNDKGKRSLNKLFPSSVKTAQADTSATTALWKATVTLDGIPTTYRLDRAIAQMLKTSQPPKESPTPY
jgi:hypothetical protein